MHCSSWEHGTFFVDMTKPCSSSLRRNSIVPCQSTERTLALAISREELRAAGADPYLVVFGTNVIDNRGDVDKRFDLWSAPVIVPLSGNWVGALPAQPVITG